MFGTDLWCSIALVKGMSPIGLTGVNFLHGEYIQQNRFAVTCKLTEF